MNKTPSFTIITPVYNREKIIVPTIESVLQQEYDYWEYIIVDDGSEDNTWELLVNYAEKHENIKAVQRTRQPKGAQTCRNMGIEEATGDFLIFLDSDDILKPFCLQQRALFLKKNPLIDLAFFPKENPKNSELESLLTDFLKYNLPIQTTDALWNKDFIKRIGGLNEKLSRFQDVELHIRALLDTNIKFSCSSEHKADSVYMPQHELTNKNSAIFIAESLEPFIKEVYQLLEEKKYLVLRHHLRYYLCSWLIHYHHRETIKHAEKLIELLYNLKIVSYRLYRILNNVYQWNFLFTEKAKIGSKILYYSIFKLK